ncbi:MULTISPECIES: peptidoglycan-binding protein [Mesorhizobium]|uniref:Peptidoglycan-binding protein n=2 Tax=Mesorhizobium TaxID=68287 RepID=A0A1A5IBA9_RHILI|nr:MULTISPECIES: peptidoglycan-binding protein [Mesorhizobium]MBE1708171.1 SEL1-like repeat protein [Mesorhizobium japonicum]MBE1713295.1 SEL1-like repeat protein [Mesorhizobium japonicum]MUT21075.1 peptidoglycan-binding protein [Mesorhizobium japonicum]MUT26758.1 peptidoglycan-binding protein [Mesorhizobium japonicum]OBP73622.1 peptidoglycan-binding protein [Mesorhizobium loti]
MNSKRSYLDTLNAGRQRKPQTTLEQLNRSLETLEQRLGQTREEVTARPAPRQYGTDPRYPATEPRYPAVDPRYPATQPTGQQRWYEDPRPAARPQTPAPTPSFDQNYQAIARDIDRVRGQEDSVAMVGKIAGELRGMREELRHQMTAGLQREFDALRKDIDRAFQANGRPGTAGKGSAELGVEFERLSGAIKSLSEKSDDRSVNMLRLELEQVKAALDTLAREESVQKVDRRWDDFDRRWTAFEDRVDADQRKRSDDPALAGLTDRLEQISNAVNNLPESLSLRSLEDKVRTLASAVEHFAGQQDNRGGDTLAMIDERLDEISRAIVASTVAAQANSVDHEAFDRIEKRIDSLARQIEEVAQDRPGAAVMDRLSTLSSRVDELAGRANLPEQAMERLAKQITLIADKIDQAPAMPDADYIFHGLEQRFDVLSGMMERRQGDAIEQGNMLFRDLERRLDEVADRLDQRLAPQIDSAGIMEAIDARFTALATRMETRVADPGGEAAIRGLESRLEDISSRLDASAAQVAGIDPALIRSLEAQVAGLSAHLSRPSTPLPEFEDISPRLDEIEKALAGTRDSILGAAREAAENAVRSLAGSNANASAVSGLAQDLKTLETLTRRSDERNSRTFEAIHDTLLKIVDRLGSLETGEPPEAVSELLDTRQDEAAGKRRTRTAKMAVEAPSMDIDEPMPLTGDMADLDGRAATIMRNEQGPRSDLGMRGDLGTRSPAEAAAAAAMAALGSDTIAERDQPAGRKSMFGGLARAFRGKKAADIPPLAGSAPSSDIPTVDLDEPLDPKAANRPLEPGSGAPDLNAIMKRVRDERGQPAKLGESDAAKSDFIAAARRAAQAAAAEADALKRQSTVKGPVKALRIGDLLKARRKPILMAAAAIMLALAGLQLGKAFLSDPVQVANNDAAPIVAAQPVQTASVDTASQPKTEVQPAATDNAPARAVRQAEASAPPTKDDMAAQTALAMPSDMDAMANTVPVAEPAAPPAASAAPSGPMASAAPAPAEPIATTPMDATASEPANVAGAAQPTNTDAQPAAAAPTAANETIAKDTTGAVAPADASKTAAANKFDIPADAGPAALRDAAAGGDAKALFEIGSRYAESRGVKEDMAAAAKWYEKSAELGFAPAEYRIGNFYEKGIGVARDIKKSKTWYQLAAEQGNASAMHNLAVLFAMAADGVTDNESAAHWFQEAADLGVKDSQFNLGILAAKGVGMKQNLEESYKWFALVAKTGDKDAAAKRDEIANALRPEQLERARAATELWKAKPLNAATNSADIPESWQEGTPQTTAGIDMKKAVKNIQLILNKNGYDAGGADGVMGEKTKNAIIAFQTDNKLPATGAVDEKLVRALLARK